MRILDVRIDEHNKVQFKDFIDKCLEKNSKTKVSKLNSEFLRRCLKNEKFYQVINKSHINIADGRGVLWVARYLTLPISKHKIIRPVHAVVQMVYSGALIVLNPRFITKPISEAIPGVEAFHIMMQSAVDKNAEVFIFGGTENNLKLAIENIQKDFPKLKISGSLNGYDFQKDESINPVDEINKTNAKMLIVALGSPRQEFWIAENIDKLKNIRVAVGEGGTLDRIANPNHMAPKFINRLGLEWLWRTLFNKSAKLSDKRIARFWNAVPLFICDVVKWKIKNGQTKI